MLSRNANSLVEPELPLRGYFLSVGSALFLLLLAADWVLPEPLPSRLRDSQSALPPIRIHSEMKKQDAVIFDTSGFGLRATTTVLDVAEAISRRPKPRSGDPVAATPQPPSPARR